MTPNLGSGFRLLRRCGLDAMPHRTASLLALLCGKSVRLSISLYQSVCQSVCRSAAGSRQSDRVFCSAVKILRSGSAEAEAGQRASLLISGRKVSSSCFHVKVDVLEEEEEERASDPCSSQCHIYINHHTLSPLRGAFGFGCGEMKTLPDGCIAEISSSEISCVCLATV